MALIADSVICPHPGMCSLVPAHVFGLNVNITNNIHYLDETNILYVAGASLVIYNTDSKTQVGPLCVSRSDLTRAYDGQLFDSIEIRSAV